MICIGKIVKMDPENVNRPEYMSSLVKIIYPLKKISNRIAHFLLFRIPIPNMNAVIAVSVTNIYTFSGFGENPGMPRNLI